MQHVGDEVRRPLVAAATDHRDLHGRPPARATSAYHCALGFGRPREGLPVDRDEAERLAEAVVPLEVVEQAPVAVAAHVDAVGDARVYAAQGAGDVVDAVRVVVGAEAVLGDEHRQRAAGVVVHPAQAGLERLRPDLGAHLGELDAGRHRGRAVRTHDRARVDLYAEEVVAGRRVEVGVLHELPGGLDHLLTARGGLVVGHRQGETDLSVWNGAADGVDGPPVGGALVLHHRPAQREVLLARREPAVDPADGGHRVRLVDGGEHVDVLGEGCGRAPGVRREAVGDQRVLPAAVGSHPARGREVVQRDERGEPAVTAAGRHRPVVVERGDGPFAGGRLDPGPFDREPVGAEVQGGDDVQVLRPPVERVARVAARLLAAGAPGVLEVPPVGVGVGALGLMG